MKDTKTPVRLAFVNLLSGITYQLSEVPVGSDKLPNNKSTDLYILLINQEQTPDNTKCDFTGTHYITVDIVNKTGNGVSRIAVNEVAGIVMQRVLPNKKTTGLVPPTGWQFHNITIEGDRDLDLQLNSTSHVVRRLLTFKITVIQN